MELIQQAPLMDDRVLPQTAPAIIAPRVMSATMSQPTARPNSGEDWHRGLGEAFGKAGGVFLTVHNSPPGSIEAVDQEPRSHSTCLQFMPFSFRALGQMVRLIRENRIEIIVWHFVQPLSNPYVWALSVLCPGVRHWLTDHVSQSLPLAPPPGRLVRFLKSLLLKRYSRVICVSDFVAAHLARRGYSNIVTNYMFVDTDRFRPDPDVRARMRGELDLEGRFGVLFTGHMIREKGGLVALEALSRLDEGVVLVVVGDGPHLREMQAAAERLGLAARVRFVGRRADVAPYMQACDIAICPSVWAEAAGLVNMEAQACGLPVVASRVGGIPEIVQEGISGLLYETGNAEALASSIAILKGDEDIRRRMGVAGRARMIERFSAQARIPIYLEQYSSTR